MSATNTLACAFASAALLSLSLSAQIAHVGVHTGSGTGVLARESNLPSAAYPVGLSLAADRYALPALSGVFVGANRPDGGVAVDQTNGDVWTTSITSVFPAVANSISRESNPNYRPTASASASLVGVIPFGVAVAGLAIDSTGAAGFGAPALFLVDTSGTLNVMTAAIPPAPLAGPIVLPGLAGTVPSGAGWDPISRSLWVSTRQGQLRNYTPVGVPTGLARTVTGFTFPIVGCTVNSSTSAGFFPPPFCSTQNPGDFNVCVVDLTGAIIDSVTNRIIQGALQPGETAFGLGASADPQTLVGAGPNGPQMTLSRPLVNTLTPSATLDVTNLAPLATGVFAFDLCPIPVGAPVGLDTWWLNTASPSFLTSPMVVTGTTSSVSLAIVSTALHGTQFTAQAAQLTPVLRLSDALVLTVGAP